MFPKFKKSISEFIVKLQKIPVNTQYNSLIKSGFLEIGKHTYGIPEIDVYAGSEAKVIIGKYCSISKGVKIITGGIHPKNWVSLYPFRTTFNLEGAYADGMPATKGDIKIGNDVWIGTNSVIMSGVTIGDGAIIAAGSIVIKNVAPYSIVGGTPSKFISYRIEEKFIPSMMEIKWWNWDDKKILEEVDLLSSENVDAFVMKFKKNSGAE